MTLKSIRSKLLFALLAGISAIVLISYLCIYSYVSRSLKQQYDSNLARKIQAFALMGEWEDELEIDPSEAEYNDFGDDPDDLIRFEFAEIEIPEYQPSPKAEYYQVWDDAGLVLARSPSLGVGNLPRSRVLSNEAHLEDILLPDSRRGRMATVILIPKWEVDSVKTADEDTRLVLSLARSSEELYETLTVLSAGLSLAGLTTILVASVLIWITVRRGLKPLDEISREIEALGSEELDYRFSTEDKSSEMVPICTCLNGLLDKLSSAFNRERNFTSNVAHELRTPIAELRALAEVCRNRPHASEADQRSFEDAHDIALQMERIVSALLTLARCASGQIAKDMKQSDLGKLIETSWAPFEQEAKAKALSLEIDSKDCHELETDAVILGNILKNIFSNAVTYTPSGGTIHLALESRDDGVSLTLSNSTDDSLTQQDLTHVFDTFWRKNKSEENSTHLGVGLPLVAAFAGVLGINVQSDISSQGLFQISLLHP